MAVPEWLKEDQGVTRCNVFLCHICGSFEMRASLQAQQGEQEHTVLHAKLWFK